MPSSNAPKRYLGSLDSASAAAALQAARLNALELLETAEILYKLKRFPHSMAFSILSIEEAGKRPILQTILLTGTEQLGSLWRSYRQHQAKTATLNVGIESRIRATFPYIPRDQAKALAERGPTPEELEISKQEAIYSDCLDREGEFHCHLPDTVDWHELAWHRLCEARSLVRSPRDLSPDELEVWVKHGAAARESGRSLESVLPELHKELLEKGFVKEGAWDTLLSDLKQV